MQVTKELFDLSNEILETYDPGKLKAREIEQVEEERGKIWSNGAGAGASKEGPGF